MTLANNRIAAMRKMDENLAVDYQGGLSEQAIGIRYGFSVGTVCRHLHKLGITARSKAETSLSHGHNKVGHRTGTYNSWDTMIQRCLNPKNTNYRNYGGRGITVCQRWRTFENFLADMGERPARLTLERKNTNGNYEPGNCSWVTRKQQLNNKRTNVFISYQGKRLTLAQWAIVLGVNYMSLWHQHRRAKTWPPR